MLDDFFVFFFARPGPYLDPGVSDLHSTCHEECEMQKTLLKFKLTSERKTRVEEAIIQQHSSASA